MTYSPGRLARGSSFPITAHSISRPTTSSSTMILRSYLAANSMALVSDFLSVAFETPTDDPRFAGFTKQGRPILCTIFLMTGFLLLSHSDRNNQVWRQIGRPASLKSAFIVIL